MQPDENSRVYSLTLDQLGAVAAASAARPSISASLDYLIWTVETAAGEQAVREAKAMLEEAIDAYLGELTNRIHGSTSTRQRAPLRQRA